MKQPSNARQISAAHSFNLMRFVFFQELSEPEWAAYKELVRQAKEGITETPRQSEEINFENQPNMKKETPAPKTTPKTPIKDATKTGNYFKPRKEMIVGGNVPAQKAPENLSTAKPVITLTDLDTTALHKFLCTGIAYQSGVSFNRNGVGTPIRFVAVMGVRSWAMYYGKHTDLDATIAAYGDKVCTETQVRALVDCDEILEYYRF